MSDLNASAIITALSDDYANNLITFSKYRSQRRIILLQLEKELNQVVFKDNEDEDKKQCSTLLDMESV